MKTSLSNEKSIMIMVIFPGTIQSSLKLPMNNKIPLKMNGKKIKINIILLNPMENMNPLQNHQIPPIRIPPTLVPPKN
jgi:hypothetical protein